MSESGCNNGRGEMDEVQCVWPSYTEQNSEKMTRQDRAVRTVVLEMVSVGQHIIEASLGK